METSLFLAIEKVENKENKEMLLKAFHQVLYRKAVIVSSNRYSNTFNYFNAGICTEAEALKDAGKRLVIVINNDGEVRIYGTDISINTQENCQISAEEIDNRTHRVLLENLESFMAGFFL